MKKFLLIYSFLWAQLALGGGGGGVNAMDVGTLGIIVEDEELSNLFKFTSNLVDVKLKSVSKTIQTDDIMEAIQNMCALMDAGVNVVFGPTSPVSSLHVSSLSKTFDLPHIEFRWDPSLVDDEHSINLFPEPTQIAEAQTALMEYWKWKQIALIYESDDDIIQMRRLLQELQEDGIRVSYFKRDKGETFRELLRSIKQQGIPNIVVDLEEEQDKIQTFLRHAMQVSMLNEQFNYFFLSLDFHVAELDEFMHSRANITALRLVNMKHHIADNLLRGVQGEETNAKKPHGKRTTQRNGWSFQENGGGVRENRNGNGLWQGHRRKTRNGATNKREASEEVTDEQLEEEARFPKKLETEVALIYDAIMLFKLGVKDLVDKKGSFSRALPTARCHGKKSLDNEHLGTQLTKTMLKKSFDGATGRVNFNDKGIREDFVLYITELGTDGLEEIGIWSKAGKLNITNDENEFEISVVENRKEIKRLKIVTVISKPWLMIDDSKKAGGDTSTVKYRGFLVSLLEKMRQNLKFEYEIYLSPDGKYGVETKVDNDTLEWNGMIGELVKKNADMAMADLVVTDKRFLAVDFTLPFMSAQLVAVIKAPTPRKPGGVWSFFLPLTREVWVYTIVAGCLTALVMYMCARFSLSEYVHDPENTNEVDNQLSIKNCLLFVFTTLLHQRPQLDPNATSTRLIAGFWYFFTFVILAIIAGNLCESVLYVDDDLSQYETIHGLLKSKTLQFTCIESGATCRYIDNAETPVIGAIKQRMERDETPRVKNAKEAFAKLEANEELAYIMEYATAKHLLLTSCNLIATKPFANHASYAFALTKGSPDRYALSAEVLRLQSLGEIHMLEEVWWKSKRYCDVDNDGDVDAVDFDEDEDDGDAVKTVELRALGPGDLSGAFILLLLGLAVAFGLGIAEIIFEYSTRESRDTYFNMIAIIDHIRNAFKMQTNQVDLSELELPKRKWKQEFQQKAKQAQQQRQQQQQDINGEEPRRRSDQLSSKIPQYQ